MLNSQKFNTKTLLLIWALGAWSLLCSFGMLYFSFSSFESQTIPPNYEYQAGVLIFFWGAFWGWAPASILAFLIRKQLPFREIALAFSPIPIALIATIICFGFAK